MMHFGTFFFPLSLWYRFCIIVPTYICSGFFVLISISIHTYIFTSRMVFIFVHGALRWQQLSNQAIRLPSFLLYMTLLPCSPGPVVSYPVSFFFFDSELKRIFFFKFRKPCIDKTPRNTYKRADTRTRWSNRSETSSYATNTTRK